MRLGRRLSSGVAEDPPAPVPAETRTPAPVVGKDEPVAEPADARTPDAIGTGG
jgi:hypothetical protein